MINSPVGDVIEKDTRDIINTDISHILNQGRQGKSDLMTSAKMEEVLGKTQRKQSVWNAVGTGLSGAGSMAWMGYDSGMFSGDYKDYKLAKKHGIL